MLFEELAGKGDNESMAEVEEIIVQNEGTKQEYAENLKKLIILMDGFKD